MYQRSTDSAAALYRPYIDPHHSVTPAVVEPFSSSFFYLGRRQGAGTETKSLLNIRNICISHEKRRRATQRPQKPSIPSPFPFRHRPSSQLPYNSNPNPNQIPNPGLPANSRSNLNHIHPRALIKHMTHRRLSRLALLVGQPSGLNRERRESARATFLHERTGVESRDAFDDLEKQKVWSQQQGLEFSNFFARGSRTERGKTRREKKKKERKRGKGGSRSNSS